MSPRPDNRLHSALALGAMLIVYAAIGLFFAAHARPNIDEGMFLSAGRLVSEGQLPYRDFPFAQAPLLAVAFAPASAWPGSPLFGGRLLALAIGVLGMAGALWLARRLAGDFAALVTLLVSLATLPMLQVSATARAQALATPLLVLGVAALALRRRGVWSWALAPALLLAASGLRLTNGLVFAAVFGWVAWQLRRMPAQLAGVAALVGAELLLISLPALLAPAQASFQVVTAQLWRGGRFGYAAPLAFTAELARRLGGYLELLPDAAILIALALPLLVLQALRGCAWSGRRSKRSDLGAPLVLAGLGALAFAPHLLLGNAFLEYLIPLWALLAPAVGIGVASELARRGAGWRARLAIALALAALAGANALRSSDVWIGSGNASFASFRRVGAELGALGGPDCTMLTLETELAVEAGCAVLPGLEYSYFAYFAELPTAEAQRLGVANLELLRERVAALRPALIALAPGHAHLLLGPSLGAAPGEVRPRLPGSVAPLEFLGPLARHYTLYETRLEIPSGVRRPGERDTAPLLVYVRSGAW